MKFKIILYYIIGLFELNGNICKSYNRVYNLSNVLYEAEEIQVLNETVHKLLGVPYGNVPDSYGQTTLYNQTIKDKNKIIKANKWGPICVQPILFNHAYYGNFKLQQDYEIKLDCLTINVYVPKKLNNKKLLTAMLFLHGGSNAAGTSSFIDGSALASVGNVVVAMPNYRLDVLGFFNMHSIKGNAGLWDTIVALEWLYNNCETLGCNKSDITLFGHSAGSSDAHLLTLSKHAKKYINRAILQSGSGLAHWAFAYETHFFDKIKDYVKVNDLNLFKTKNLIELTNFDKSKYVNSLNDTFNNFVVYTSCNLTKKHECFKNKIQRFYNFKNEMKINKPNRVIQTLENIFNSLDLSEVLSFFGYLHNDLIQRKTQSEIKQLIKIVDPFYASANMTASSTPSFENFLKRNNYGKIFKSNEYKKFQTHPCYAELMHFIWGSENLIIVCDFIASYGQQIYDENVIKYFLECFQLYYVDHSNLEKDDNKNYQDNLADLALEQNTHLFITEMQLCIKQASILTQIENNEKFNSDKINNLNLNPQTGLNQNDISSEKIANTIRELSFLTENANYLHRPTLDNYLFDDTPHQKMNDLSEKIVDTLVGVNSHESFYFLLHEFNLNHIIMHTFMYSSMLNLTDNLLFKMIRLNINMNLNVCIRKSLFNYYNFSLSDEELRKNSLKGVYSSLELLSDYDFVLPMITQLKSEMEKSKKNITHNILYVYEYSKLPSFNYLLNFMKNIYKSFDDAEKFHNKTIVPHYSELDFVFGLPILSKSNLIDFKDNTTFLFNYTNEEYDLSLLMINYWTNFAKYGNPNVKDKPLWEKFNHSSPNILRIKSAKPNLDTSLIEKWLKVHEFWYEILPNKIFDECSKIHDADLSSDNNVNRHVFDKLLENNVKYYQNKASSSKNDFSYFFFTFFFNLVSFSLTIFTYFN